MEGPELRSSIFVAPPVWCHTSNLTFQKQSIVGPSCVKVHLVNVESTLVAKSMQPQKLLKRKPLCLLPQLEPAAKTRLQNHNLLDLSLKKSLINLKNDQLKNAALSTKNTGLTPNEMISVKTSASSKVHIHSRTLDASMKSGLNNRILSTASSHGVGSKLELLGPTKNNLSSHSKLPCSKTVALATSLNKPSVTKFADSPLTHKREAETLTTKTSKRLKPNVHRAVADAMPRYSFSLDQDEDILKPVPNFDISSGPPTFETEARTRAKLSLLHAVSSSLISGPNMKERTDVVRLNILERCESVAEKSPEFVLKVALYTRNELNIRTTTNLLLAFSAYNTKCRRYLAKYFCASVRLPSDWLDIAEQYQLMHDETLKAGSLPAALRRVMVTKFAEFDEYQLAKYNREKKKPKKTKVQTPAISLQSEFELSAEDFPSLFNEPENELGIVNCHTATKEQEHGVDAGGGTGAELEADDDEEVDHYVERKFTLKQLVRLLHITRPAEHVMALVGKKYPSEQEQFRASGLSGYWEEERAGKRMKLPTPETWETQVSLKGNKASTWKSLIDNRKLPFMAMLRNLRNMILAGISEKHHAEILKILTNEKAVENSRQFPFRFLAAYDVLNELEKKYLLSREEEPKVQKMKRFTKNNYKGKKPAKGLPYNIQLLDRYRAALNEAIHLATTLNVPPIPGTTIVLLDVNRYTNVPCTSARGLGKPRTVQEVALLLGLMCQAACENSVCLLYAKNAHHIVEPTTTPLLEQISLLKAKAEEMTDGDRYDPNVDKQDFSVYTATQDFLNDLLHDQVQVNNLLVLSNSTEGDALKKFLPLYRKMVNPHLLFVSVDLSAKSTSLEQTPDKDKTVHPNNVWLSGFSDQLLRFVAERGSSQQLDHVENIDIKYNLDTQNYHYADEHEVDKTASDSICKPGICQPSWRIVRVFISSTFRDMHGERDLLVRYIFPELRKKARSLFLDVHEVDLRWGITEHETEENKALQVCLQEASRCHIFIGILGERYGHVPNLVDIPLTEEFDWVRQYPSGASITELEFHAGALSRPAASHPSAFIYIRDGGFLKHVPAKRKADFQAESSEAQEQLNKLKKKVLQSGVSVYNGYPCHWGGVVGDRPILTGLEILGQKVLADIWKCLVHLASDERSKVTKEAQSVESLSQNMTVKRHCDSFVGQKHLVEQCIDAVAEKKVALIVLCGKAGSGKTATLAHLLMKFKSSQNLHVVGYFVNATPNSNSVRSVLRYLCQELCLQLKKPWSPQPNASDSRLTAEFFHLLDVSVKQWGRLVLIVDNLDGLSSDSMLTWLPDPLPQGVVFVGSITHGALVQKTLILREATFFNIKPLSLPDKSMVVKQMLQPYRKVLTDTLFNNQLRLLVSKSEAGRPLYLYMASQQLRMHGSFEQMTVMLQQLPPTLDGLLKMRIDYINELYGSEIVSVVLGLLSCAKDGLMVEELWGLINIYWNLGSSQVSIVSVREVKENPETMLPPIRFGQLIMDLEGLLVSSPDEKEPTLSFSHTEVIKLVQAYYKQSKIILNDVLLHMLMAGFYLNEADPQRDRTWQGQSLRPFARIVHHLLACGCLPEAIEVLTDLQFLHAKSRLGIADMLLEEFNSVRILATGQMDSSLISKFDQYQQFVARNHHIIASSPTLLLQQALNEPSSSAPATDSEQLVGSIGFPSALQWLNKPMISSACTDTIVHAEPVTSVGVSAREPWIAFGMHGGSVHLYNVKTGKEGFVFNGHTDSVSKLVFVGAFRLCSASNDGTLSLWDLQTGNRVAVMKGHRRRVTSCCCDTDVTIIVSASWDCTVRTWHPRSGQDLSTMKEKYPINCVALHPTRLIAAIGLWDCTLRFWDLQTVKRKAILRGHTASVKSLAFSPCGDYIVSASLNGEVRLWSAAAGIQVNAFQSHKVAINDILFLNGGTEIVTASDDHSLKVWESIFGSKRTVYRCDALMKVTSLAFCNGGASLMIVDNNSQVVNVNFQTGFINYCIKPSMAYVTAIWSDMEKNRVLIGYSSGQLKVINCESGATLANLHGSEEAVTAVLCRKSGVVAGTSGGLLLVYNLRSKLSEQNCQDVKVTTTAKGHFGQVTCIFANQAEKLFATVSRDKALKVWSVSGTKHDVDLTLVTSVEACHSDWINAGEWITGEKKTYLVTGSNDCTIKLWNFDRNHNAVREVKTLGSMPGPVIHISVWDTNVVCGSLDGTIQMFTKKGIKVLFLRGESSKCFAAVKMNSPQSKDWYERVIAEELGTSMQHKQYPWPQVVVAVGCEGGVVKAAHLLNESHGQTLSGHSGSVLSAASLWDGRLVTCSVDQTARIWQHLTCTSASDDKLNAAHKGAVTAIDWCRHYDLMISSDELGSLTLWKKSLTSLLPLPKVSVSAHPKKVTDMCFTFHEHGTVGICTVSIDGYLSFWTWDCMNPLRKEHRINAHVPLACVGYLSSENIVAAGGWDGVTLICNARSGEVLNRAWNKSVAFFSNVAFTTDDKAKFIWASYNGIALESNNHKIEVRAMHLNNFKMEMDPLIQHEVSNERGLILPTCLTAVSVTQSKNATRLLLGDSNGGLVQQSLLTGEKCTTTHYQLHKDELTACAYVAKQNLLLTASHDCLLKFWNVLHTGSFKQIAQYECMASITCLTILEEDSPLVVACGDSHGHIDFIRWLN